MQHGSDEMKDFCQVKNIAGTLWFGTVCISLHKSSQEVGLVWFLLFNNTWSFGVTYDHTFSKLANHQSDIKPQIKEAVSLVIAYGHFNLLQGFVWVCIG